MKNKEKAQKVFDCVQMQRDIRTKMQEDFELNATKYGTYEAYIKHLIDNSKEMKAFDEKLLKFQKIRDKATVN